MTRTAERIGRTQSAVSMQMRRLEEVLGEPLLRRGSRGLEPTYWVGPQGARLHKRDPPPLAAAHPGCNLRRAALGALGARFAQAP